MSAERMFEVILNVMVEESWDADLPAAVYFDYQPPEKATPDYPGCGASVTLNRVMVKEVDLLPALSQGLIEAIKRECLSSVQTGPED